MYRLILESLLGLEREGERLRLVPCLPPAWREFILRYRHGSSWYEITVRQSDEGVLGSGATCLTLDGVEQRDGWIRLVDDGLEHRAIVHVPHVRQRTDRLPAPA